MSAIFAKIRSYCECLESRETTQPVRSIPAAVVAENVLRQMQELNRQGQDLQNQFYGRTAVPNNTSQEISPTPSPQEMS